MFKPLLDIWRYRSLIVALVTRHLAARYRGSVLGFMWSFLNPLCLMLVYALVFKYYIRFSEVPNYAVFLLCGLLPWTWFTAGLSEGTGAIVSGGHLITKSMFPAHILPTVAVITNFIHFILALPILLILLMAYGMTLHVTLLFLPVIFALQLVLMYGLVLLLSSLNVRYRDVQHLVANVLTFMFFLCPIVYPASAVPERFAATINLNPVALLVTFYHDVIVSGVMPQLSQLLFVAGFGVLAVVAGVLVLGRTQESFAELL